MATQNWFVPIGGGKKNRAYFQPGFGIWEWQWKSLNVEKQITVFAGYSRASIGNSKIKWRGIYPYGRRYIGRDGRISPNSLMTLLTLFF